MGLDTTPKTDWVPADLVLNTDLNEIGANLNRLEETKLEINPSTGDVDNDLVVNGDTDISGDANISGSVSMSYKEVLGSWHQETNTTKGALFNVIAAVLDTGKAMVINGSLRFVPGSITFIVSKALRTSSTTVVLYGNNITVTGGFVVSAFKTETVSNGEGDIAAGSITW